MADGQVTIKALLDTSDVSKGVSSINGQLKSVDGAGFDKVGSSAKSAGESIKGAGDEAKATSEKMKGAGESGKDGFEGIGESAKASEGGITGLIGKVGTLAKGFAGLGAVTGTVDLTKQAVDAYSAYQQAVGGIDTLFKGSSKKVQQYAADAYKNAGMSANDYMEQVTSFAASLIQSTGGNTKKAAELANTAMQDISDNANKMGTDAEMLQQTYQSLSRGNYAMLDNLKLGYGGTKSEMERLMKDAEKMTGEHYTLGDFGDTVKAIHAVQDKLHITGTTAKEASTTIEGSLKSAQSAWQNWITGLGNPDADMGDLTSKLADSLKTVADNVIPTIGTVFGNLGTLILDRIGGAFGNGDLGKQVGDSLQQSIGDAIESIQGMLGGGDIGGDIASGIQWQFQAIQDAFNGALGGEGTQQLFQTMRDGLSSLQDALSNFATAIQPFVDGVLKPIGDAVGEFANDVLKPIAENILPGIAGAVGAVIGIIAGAIGIIAQVISAIINAGAAIADTLSKVPGAVSDAVNGISLFFSGLPDKISGFFSGIGDAIGNKFSGVPDAIKKFFDDAAEAVSSVPGRIAGFFSGIASKVGSRFSGVPDAIGKTFKSASDFVKGIPGRIAGFFSGIASKVSRNFTSIPGAIGRIFSAAANAARGIPGRIAGMFTGIASKIGGMVSGVRSAIARPFEAAWNAISGIPRRIQDAFNFSWSLPTPHIPHFNISGGEPPYGFGGKGSFPQVSISWNAVGGIFTGATLFGAGEAGDEMLTPLSGRRKMRPFTSMIADDLEGRPGGGNTYIINGLTVAPESALARAMEDVFEEANRKLDMGEA